MSLSYAFRCDICGESVYAPADAPPEAIPGDWATFTIKHPNEPERTCKGHVCPACAKALESGEALDIYRLRHAVTEGTPAIVAPMDGLEISEGDPYEEPADVNEEVNE